MANERFKGIPHFMNGRDYLIPSLSTGQFEDNYDLLTSEIPAVTDGKSLRAQYGKYYPVILLAVQRNYPEVTMDQLRDWVGVDDFPQLLRIVQGASGLTSVKPGE